MVGYGDSENSALRDGWLCTGTWDTSQWAALHHWKSEGNGYRQWQKLYPQDIEQLVSSIDGVYKGHCLALGHTHSSGR